MADDTVLTEIRVCYRIGYSMARRMCQEGADVVISSRRAENVSKAVASLHAEGFTSVVGIQCDVGNSQHRKDLIEQVVWKPASADSRALKPFFLVICKKIVTAEPHGRGSRKANNYCVGLPLKNEIQKEQQ